MHLPASRLVFVKALIAWAFALAGPGAAATEPQSSRAAPPAPTLHAAADGAAKPLIAPVASHGVALHAVTGGATFGDKLFGSDFARLFGQHVLLVAAAVAIAIGLGLPLGILAARRPALGQGLLALTGVLHTIPALALLAMLIPIAGGAGFAPALAALSLCALLPIVQNTRAGLAGVPPGLKQAALSLGLRPRQCLTSVELPLAMPVILAGVKTASVTAVGTATIAAFAGAGGFGERIVTGLASNDHATLLAGALPAAALALAVQALFAPVEKRHNRAAAARLGVAAHA